MHKITNTKTIEKSIKSITDPKIDFIVPSDISEKQYKNVYSKIHSELNNFIANKKKMSESKFRGNRSEFVFDGNKIRLDYDKDIIELIINGEKSINSNIFGIKIDKEIGIVKDIKIDLASLKKEISKLF